MEKKKDNDKIKSRSKRRAPVVRCVTYQVLLTDGHVVFLCISSLGAT